jgi:hypothetical protein
MRTVLMTNSDSIDKDFGLQKLDSAINLISRLIDGDHPHRDSRQALEQIIEVYSQERETLRDLDETAQLDTVLERCRRVNIKLERLKKFLGLLIRSTNIRNAFEFYFPVRILAAELVSPSVRIVIGSEWNFSPYTYPMALPELPDFIFIGIPASECQNPLILPLAGHELGHVVWRRKGAKTEFDKIIRTRVLELYKKYWTEFDSLFRPKISQDKLEIDMFAQNIWGQSNQLAQRQLEEIFCDFMGIYIFGRSFLHSFRYLLAPSLGQTRVPPYPPIKRRVEYMLFLAQQYGVEDSGNFQNIFSETEIQLTPNDAFILKIADEATQQLYKELIPMVDKYHGSVEKFTAGANGEKHIKECLNSLVPPNSIQSIPALINAAWDIRLNLDDWELFNDLAKNARWQEKLRVLRDLVLKGFEVYEYGKRLERHAAKRT